MTNEAGLRRDLGLVMLSLYGLGTTIGAGIFVLIGKIAGLAGMAAPASFLVAGLLVAGAALSFAELSARFPRAAGEAVYVENGFGWQWLAILTGLAVMAGGIVSASTIARGFAGYFDTFLSLNPVIVTLGAVALMTLIAGVKIKHAVGIASLISVLEISALLVAGGGAAGDAIANPAPLSAHWPADMAVWTGVLAGSVLAFYAFIGFEDMVNAAEEVRDPVRTMPRAIIITLVLTLLLYGGITLIAVRALPPEALAASDAPLATLFHETTGLDARLIASVAIVAVLNGAMIQILMAARILYGMSNMGWLPKALGQVNAATGTPVRATVLVGLIIAVLATSFDLVALAKGTSFIALSIFALVSAALVKIKLGGTPAPGFSVPLIVPILGTVMPLALLGYELLRG